MIRTRTAIPIAAVLLAMLCPWPAHAAEGPRLLLKGEATVAGDVIRVADVADLSDDMPAAAADVVLGNAPWPGFSRPISRALVRVRLVSAGIRTGRIRFDGDEVCRVTRDSIRVEGADLVAVARKHLESCLPPSGGDVQVELLRDVDPLFLARQAGEARLRPTLCGADPIGRVRVEVAVVQGGVQMKKVSIGFNVRVRRDVAVARVRIARGELLTDRNVTFVRRDVDSLVGKPILALEELRGMAAGRVIQPGGVLTTGLMRPIEQPVVIQHNQRVLLVVRCGNLRGYGYGKSLNRARLGEVVRVVNLDTGREVSGIAVGGSMVEVLIGGDNDK